MPSCKGVNQGTAEVKSVLGQVINRPCRENESEGQKYNTVILRERKNWMITQVRGVSPEGRQRVLHNFELSTEKLVVGVQYYEFLSY